MKTLLNTKFKKVIALSIVYYILIMIFSFTHDILTNILKGRDYSMTIAIGFSILWLVTGIVFLIMILTED